MALEECVGALQRALTAPMSELAAEDLRLAARALGRITGRVDVEEILDVVFRDKSGRPLPDSSSLYAAS
jgi:tRNA modification GTPase